MSAPGRHTDVATSAARTPHRPPAARDALGMHSTIRAAAPRGEVVPAQLSGYAATPIRSDILSSDIGMSLKDPPSCGLARLVPSTLASAGPARPGRYTTGPALDSGRRCPRGRALTPRRLVAQHGPAADQELTRQGHDGLLLAGLAAAEPLVDGPRPAVVAEHDPGALDQQLPQQRRAAPRDAAAAVRLARLVLARHQAGVGRDLLAAVEAARLVQVGDDGLGGARADAGHRLQELDGGA